MNKETRDIIDQVAQDWVNEDRMFTAFEISLQVQRLLTERQMPVLRHSTMRETVHQILQGYLASGVYHRTLMDVGAEIPANVYFPDGADSDEYVPLKRRPEGAPPVQAKVVSRVVEEQATPESDPAATTVTVPADDSTARPDGRGTICVPAELLREAGFKVNEKAFVYAEQDSMGNISMVVSKSDKKWITSYTVDKSINVRITATTLEIGGLDTSKDARYRFERKGDDVILTNV